ncbi:hypothetical protein C8Q74DRAFT_1229982 [Fomes fomentarius]|nr:hypothetical protein C8Q74DRAFT_1229982 [Fomes fomentarius]
MPQNRRSCPHRQAVRGDALEKPGGTFPRRSSILVMLSAAIVQNLPCPSPMDEHVSLVAWQEEPKFRGTFTILTSCLSTLFICTWSVLQVDVQHGKSTITRFRDKCGWLLVGLLAPGIVLLTAINQFLTARSLTRAAQARFRDMSPSAKRNSWIVRILCQLVSRWRSRRVRETTTEAQDSSEHETSGPQATPGLRDRSYQWTLTHGFYASMGGFALRREWTVWGDSHYLPSWQRNGILTPEGMLLVIELAPNTIPDIDVKDLLDRDGLAKVLLVWQAVWFCLSCLNRTIQGLPLCLLEVATLAHAFCALLAYAFWWRKPQDVGEPIVLEGDEIRTLGAWMSVASPARRSVVAGMITLTYDSEFRKALYSMRSFNDWSNVVHHDTRIADDHVSLSHIHVRQIPPLPDSVLVPVSPFPPPPFLGALKARYIFRGEIWPWYMLPHIPNVECERYTARLQLFVEALQQYPGLPYPPPDNIYVTSVASLQSSSPSPYQGRFVRSILAIMVLAAVYGLPHLIGIKAIFTTTTERRMWQVATILISAAAGAATLVLIMALFALIRVLWSFSQGLDKVDLYCKNWVVPGMYSLGVIVYYSSSTYLVAESFRQLTALPPESFILPSWGNYLPHFA